MPMPTQSERAKLATALKTRFYQRPRKKTVFGTLPRGHNISCFSGEKEDDLNWRIVVSSPTGAGPYFMLCPDGSIGPTKRLNSEQQEVLLQELMDFIKPPINQFPQYPQYPQFTRSASGQGNPCGAAQPGAVPQPYSNVQQGNMSFHKPLPQAPQNHGAAPQPSPNVRQGQPYGAAPQSYSNSQQGHPYGAVPQPYSNVQQGNMSFHKPLPQAPQNYGAAPQPHSSVQQGQPYGAAQQPSPNAYQGHPHGAAQPGAAQPGSAPQPHSNISQGHPYSFHQPQQAPQSPIIEQQAQNVIRNIGNTLNGTVSYSITRGNNGRSNVIFSFRNPWDAQKFIDHAGGCGEVWSGSDKTHVRVGPDRMETLDFLHAVNNIQLG